MQQPTKYGTTTFHPTLDMAEPNLSSASHPHAIF